jgi:hemolysin III
MSGERRLTWSEDLASSVTHGLGLIASVVGLPVLLLAAASRRDAWILVGYSVFAATLVTLYAASTVYHAFPPHRARAKRVLRVIDHSAIYLLIAGSYTPFLLGNLRGAWGWSLLGVVWGLAGLGILAKAAWGPGFSWLSALLYVGMGWLAVVAIRPLAAALPPAGLAWLFAGGLCYTAGVPFFLWDRLRHTHTVWHVFVLAGSACHYWAVLRYAAGPR